MDQIEEKSQKDSRVNVQNNQHDHSKPLLVNAEKRVTADPVTQSKITTDHFGSMFWKDEIAVLPKIAPQSLDAPFQGEEVEKAAKALKSNKSTGRRRSESRTTEARANYHV